MLTWIALAGVLACSSHTPEAPPPAEPVVEVQRPQTPAEPFPYTANDLTVTGAGEVKLTGTLTLPDGEGPHPVVLMLSGSGAQDRDLTVAEHRPNRVWADRLARRGVASLRLDDRGAGTSEGDLNVATDAELEADARAALAQLRETDGIDATRVGLMSHGDGGNLAAALAVADPELAGVVVLSAPGTSGRTVLLDQAEAILVQAGVPTEAAFHHRQAHANALQALLDGAPLREPVTALMDAQISVAYEYLGASIPDDRAPLVDAAIASLERPRFRAFAASRPQDTWDDVTQPVLAIGGERDLQVLAEPNLAGLRKALDRNPHATVMNYPGLNHWLQPAKTGMPEEYGLIDTTIDEQVVTATLDWLEETLGAPAAPAAE